MVVVARVKKKSGTVYKTIRYQVQEGKRTVWKTSRERVCKKCGHTECPVCGDWCDVMLKKGKPCCDGECTY